MNEGLYWLEALRDKIDNYEEVNEEKIVALIGNISEEQKTNAEISGIEVISGNYEAEIILK